MCFDQEKGWTVEVLGPKSGHWKRLARQVKTKSPQEISDPPNQKRKRDISVSELNTNVCRKRRAKGKLQAENNSEEDGKMAGGVAVAAGQPRPAQ